MWIALLHGISFSVLPLSSLSPFKIYVLSQALRQGWRRSLPLSLAPLIADIPVILLIWLVLSQLPAWTLNVLRILGGLFYAYLAYHLVRRTREPDPDPEEVLEDVPRRTFREAIVAVWLSPPVYINWSSIGVPALLGYGAQSAWYAIAFLAGFYVLWVGGLAAQIFLVGQAGKYSAKANAVVLVAAALFLTGFGAYQIWIGLTTLIG